MKPAVMEKLYQSLVDGICRGIDRGLDEDDGLDLDAAFDPLPADADMYDELGKMVGMFVAARLRNVMIDRHITAATPTGDAK